MIDVIHKNLLNRLPQSRTSFNYYYYLLALPLLVNVVFEGSNCTRTHRTQNSQLEMLFIFFPCRFCLSCGHLIRTLSIRRRMDVVFVWMRVDNTLVYYYTFRLIEFIWYHFLSCRWQNQRAKNKYGVRSVYGVDTHSLRFKLTRIHHWANTQVWFVQYTILLFRVCVCMFRFAFLSNFIVIILFCFRFIHINNFFSLFVWRYVRCLCLRTDYTLLRRRSVNGVALTCTHIQAHTQTPTQFFTLLFRWKIPPKFITDSFLLITLNFV